MNEIIQKLGKEAGFDFDPTDCNFYGREGWCNKEISRLVQLTAAEVCRSINNSIYLGFDQRDFLTKNIKRKFGI